VAGAPTAGSGPPTRRPEAPSLPVWLPAPPLELPVPPSRHPAPWTRVKGLQAALPPQAASGCRRKRGDAGCAAPTGRLFWTPPLWLRRPAPRSVIGLLAGPRRPAPRPWARRGASVLRHHSHRVRRNHNHHHCWARRRQQHLGMISPKGTSSSNNNSSRSRGRPASRVAGRSRAPSECNPFLPLICLSCRRVLTHPLLVRASSPSAPKVVPPLPSAAPTETAPPGPQAPTGGPAAAAPTPSGAAAVEGVPTAPTAAIASTTAMPSSTPSAAAEEAPVAPAPAIEVDAGGASSSNPPPTPKETKVIFVRQLRSGAKPEAAPIPLPRVLSRAHQALQETEAAILREWGRLRLNTSVSATGVLSWRSAPR
jgi:hypothetical protein